MQKLNPLTSRAQRMLNSAALAYQWGFVPIPITGKKGRTLGWPNTQYQTSLDEFKRFLTNLTPTEQQTINVGILTGAPSDIVVVDVDQKTGGLEQLQKLLNMYNNSQQLNTLTINTGSCGLHLYFNYTPDIADIKNFTSPLGIEYRSNGGLVVFPFSLHPNSGREYSFKTGYYEDQEGNWYPHIIDMPPWLAQYLRLVRS